MGGLTESFPDYYEVGRRAARPAAAGARAFDRSRVVPLDCARLQVLGIPRGATDAEIKRSYRKVLGARPRRPSRPPRTLRGAARRALWCWSRAPLRARRNPRATALFSRARAVLRVSPPPSPAPLRPSLQLAMKWHPDKNPDNGEEASTKFQLVGEAYAVLSDKEKKAIYDQYGYEALRDGIPDGAGGTKGGWSYKGDAAEIFSSFFGTENPFADFGFGDSVPFATRLRRPGPQKPEPIVKELDCTLEELYNGCTKKFTITRKRYSAESPGELKDDAKELVINIKPGWKKGTKVTFACEGDEGVNVVPADIVFVVSEKPHAAFAREGADLIYTANIDLVDALVGCQIAVPTLDGRVLSIPCPEVVSPGYEKLIEGEGMPLSKTPAKHGMLKIHFKLNFPKYLAQKVKDDLRPLLTPPVSEPSVKVNPAK